MDALAPDAAGMGTRSTKSDFQLPLEASAADQHQPSHDLGMLDCEAVDPNVWMLMELKFAKR
jgi:hypothetical protein